MAVNRIAHDYSGDLESPDIEEVQDWIGQELMPSAAPESFDPLAQPEDSVEIHGAVTTIEDLPASARNDPAQGRRWDVRI